MAASHPRWAPPIGSVIGRVLFEWGTTPCAAILERDGTWRFEGGSSASPELVAACTLMAEDFNRRFSFADYSPADGPEGVKLLLDAEDVLGGRAYWDDQDKPRPPAGTIY